jgi:hypothetical protein
MRDDLGEIESAASQIEVRELGIEHLEQTGR